MSSLLLKRISDRWGVSWIRLTKLSIGFPFVSYACCLTIYILFSCPLVGKATAPSNWIETNREKQAFDSLH